MFQSTLRASLRSFISTTSLRTNCVVSRSLASPLGRVPLHVVRQQRTYATYNTFRGTTNGRRHIHDSRNLWERHWKLFTAFGVGFGIFIVSNLERTPISNRLRFMIVSPAMEDFVGEQGYQQVLAQYKRSLLPDLHPHTLRVKRVMKHLIKVSGLNENMDWRVHVIHDPTAPPNAFVLPSGKVFVFTSILPIAEDDDGLATVLSHETAHVLLRHSAESLSKAPFMILANLILLYMFNIRLDGLTSILFELPSSREHESEADYAGLIMMSRACYDPSQAAHFWERMGNFERKSAGALSGAKIPELLSTHPATAHRIENMKKWLPDAEEEKARSGCYDNSHSFMEFSNLFKEPGLF